MIKSLRKSSITYTPFKAFKEWTFDSVNSSSFIPFSPREGLEINGTFYPSESQYYTAEFEQTNSDGTYKRVVYNSIDHAFYRNDNDPLKCFGVENFVHENSDINGRIAVIQLDRSNWGEKIVPNSVTITDFSNPDEIFVIKDDGNTNLYLENKTFASYDFIYPKEFPYKVEYTSSDSNFYYNIVNGVKSYMSKDDAMKMWENGTGPVFVDESKLTKTFTYLTHSYNPTNERFGSSVSTYDDYIIVGSPCDNNTFSENKSGRAFIYKINPSNGKHDVIRNLYFYGSQASLVNDNSNRAIITTELGDFILYENGELCPSGSTFVKNDGFGKSVSMTSKFAAIGAPYVEMCQDDCEPTGSGLVFCYQEDKGGQNNWGLINVLQGENRIDEFGYSVDVNGDTLVVGAPGYNSGSGAIYIFKLKKYMSDFCDTISTSSLSSGSFITQQTYLPEIVTQTVSGSGGYASMTYNRTTGLIDWEYSLNGPYSERGASWLYEQQNSTDVYPTGTVVTSIYDVAWESGGPLVASGSFSANPNSFYRIYYRTQNGNTPVNGTYVNELIETTIPSPEIDYIVTSGSNDNLTALFYNGLWQPTSDRCDSESIFPSNEEVPGYIVGDFTWRLLQKIEGPSGSRFGGDISIRNDVLVVGNRSTDISNKYAWVYTPTYTGSICPTQYWNLNTTLSSSGVITNNLPNDLDGNNESDNFFGYSVSTNGEYIAIGAPRDSYIDSHYIGSVYLYRYAEDVICSNIIEKTVSFVDRVYANEVVLESNDFGTSVSMNHNRMVVGAPKNILFDTDVSLSGSKFVVENFEEHYGRYDNRGVDGNFYIYDMNTIDLEKKINWTKRENFPNKRFGYDVSIGNELICVGSPVFSKTEETSSLFTDEPYMDIPSNWENSASSEMRGNVFSYRISDLEDNSSIGNVFYKNGTIVLTHTGSQFSNVFFTSGSESGYILNYKSQHTINEQEIIVSIEPGEFNVSTNPTSLDRKIPFDVNGDGLFDANDLSVLLKYINGEPIIDLSKIGDSIGTEQNYKWWNNGPILTESEDLLLASSIFDTISTLGVLTQERYDYIKENLVNTGLLNVDGNYDVLNPLPSGIVNANDAKILFNYFANTLTPDVLDSLIDDSSTRRYVKEMIEYLDNMTGNSGGGMLTKFQAETLQERSGSATIPMYGINNGSKIKDDFFGYIESSSLNRTGSYLAPYITTIGLYNGGELVAIGKLGKPVKNVLTYPMNVSVRFDFG